IAVGTDIGAGDEWLIPRVLNDCYKVHMSEPGDRSAAIEPAQLLFLGTLAGARALDQEQQFGNFDVGKEADFVIVDPAAQPGFELVLAAAAHGGARSHLFTLLMGMREGSITGVFVRGRRVTAPEVG
ncbi:MAG: amidohydrolase family protein, partial [Microbacterium sp.]